MGGNGGDDRIEGLGGTGGDDRIGEIGGLGGNGGDGGLHFFVFVIKIVTQRDKYMIK